MVVACVREAQQAPNHRRQRADLHRAVPRYRHSGRYAWILVYALESVRYVTTSEFPKTFAKTTQRVHFQIILLKVTKKCINCAFLTINCLF